MRVVVVVAHPDPASRVHALAAETVSALRAGGHQVTVLDLCATGFRAAMTAEEKRAYDTSQPVVDQQVAAHVETVKDAEALVIVYPTLTNGPPAVLKGWFDRVLVPGVAFVFDDHQRVRPGLRTARRLVGISTYSAPRWRVRLAGDAGRRLLTRTLRTSTGWRARVRWLALYAGADEVAFTRRVNAVLGGL